LAADELKYDGVDQTGWVLAAGRMTSFDKVSTAFSHAFIQAPPVSSNVWVLKPVDRGDSFVISLAFDANQYDGISQTDWNLDFNPNPMADARPMDSNTYELSTYATYSHNPSVWRSVKIHFSG
jgi:hypothetical protein